MLYILIGLIVGAIAGFVSGGFFKSLNMGTVWNVIMGAFGGFSVANIYMAYGFDHTDSLIWAIVWAVVGGVLGQMFFGWIRHGLHALWLVVTGKEDQLPATDPYRRD